MYPQWSSNRKLYLVMIWPYKTNHNMYLQWSLKYKNYTCSWFGLTKQIFYNTDNEAQNIKITLGHDLDLQNRYFYNLNINVYICFGMWHLRSTFMCAKYWPRLWQPWAVYGAQHKCSTIFLTMFLKFWPAWLVKEKIFLKFYILSEKKYLKLLLFPFYKFALIWQTYIDLIKIFKL